MLSAHSDWPEEHRRYGLGFHLHATTDTAWLEGYDAGVSFASVHRPSSSTTYTVISNWTDGAWPVVRRAECRARRLSGRHPPATTRGQRRRLVRSTAPGSVGSPGTSR